MTSQTKILELTTFAFLDIETTGGNVSCDRITEIGIRYWRDGEMLGEWQTLLNPETRISPFIERFTGISNEMVAAAPRFEDIADDLEAQLEGKVFVAHNARFDYGFIKSEFRRLGRVFSAKVLCTVKLSRKLYPEFRRHNMDALIARHNLAQVQRHRAMGDVAAMLSFFERALAGHGPDAMNSALGTLLQRPSIPSHLPSDVLHDLPRAPGVYRFYGENDVLLYVGKSTNIAQRVASHFSGDHNTSKGVRMSESLRRVDWTETGGEDRVKYNLRMQIAFHNLRLRTWPWKGPVGVVERNPENDRKDILIVYNWMHVATVHDHHELEDLSLGSQAVTFDLDSYRLIAKTLMAGSRERSLQIIELDAVGSPDVMMP
jgi:DNA polymerase III subunit epsilon